MVSRFRLRAWVAALGIFVLGAVTGGAASHALMERKHRDLAAGGFEGFERRRIGALTRKLDLSDEQAEKVRAILQQDRESRRKLTEDVFERCGEPLEQHRDQVDTRIRAVLSPEQSKRYEKFMREHRHDPFQGPPRGPGGHRHPPPPH
jgi:Spy/CpxP family protein refolding chaperone